MSAATLAIRDYDPDVDVHPTCALIEATTDIGLLERIASMTTLPHPEAHGAVAANRQCPADLLRRLYEGADGDIVTLMNLADNPGTPPDILAELAGHDDWVIRMVVAHNTINY